MRQINLSKALLTTAEEKENNLIETKKNVNDIKKGATDLHVTQIISLDNAHEKEKG